MVIYAKNLYLQVALIGVSAVQDVTLSAGMDILIKYLQQSPVSPIQAEFVEKADVPALATAVTLHRSSHAQTVYSFNFENVSTLDQELIPARLREVLEAELAGGFNLFRMEEIVDHTLQEV